MLPLYLNINECYQNLTRKHHESATVHYLQGYTSTLLLSVQPLSVHSYSHLSFKHLTSGYHISGIVLGTKYIISTLIHNKCMYPCTYNNNSPLLVSTNIILAQKLAMGDKEKQDVLIFSKPLYFDSTLKLKL